jgi:hypothetical protein
MAAHKSRIPLRLATTDRKRYDALISDQNQNFVGLFCAAMAREPALRPSRSTVESSGAKDDGATLTAPALAA